MSYGVMKRHGRTSVYCKVKKANLKKLYTTWFQYMTFWKRLKTMETVRNQLLWRLGAEGDK